MNRHLKAIESYDEHSKDLPELEEGDYVAVQNGKGSHPKRWDKTGRIMHKFPFRQYNVKIDGSNRLTLRNRKFLRKIDPVCAHRPPPQSMTPIARGTQPISSSVEPLPTNGEPEQDHSTPSQPVVDTAPTTNVEPIEPVRRSNRIRCTREVFQANKHHNPNSVPTT